MDVLVIGGGPAGAVGAARLAMAGAAVVLIDKANVQPEKVGESLPPLSARLIRALSIEAAFDASSHLPASGVRTAWGSRDKERPFILSPYGYGWLLDRPAFDQGLRDFAMTKGVRVIDQAKAGTIFTRRDQYHFQLVRGSKLISGIAGSILDCSGRSADFALRHGAKRITYDRLVAFWRIFHGTSVRDADNQVIDAERNSPDPIPDRGWCIPVGFESTCNFRLERAVNQCLWAVLAGGGRCRHEFRSTLLSRYFAGDGKRKQCRRSAD